MLRATSLKKAAAGSGLLRGSSVCAACRRSASFLAAPRSNLHLSARRPLAVVTERAAAQTRRQYAATAEQTSSGVVSFISTGEKKRFGREEKGGLTGYAM